MDTDDFDAPDAPRDDLIRMQPFERAEIGDGTDGRTLIGYAARFNTPTVINSWEGKFVERIAPGAFRKTLRENGDKVKVLFNHGMDPSIGDKPLGKARVLKEDADGLRVEVPLSDTSYNNDIIALLRDGALDGMSFRFSVVKESWKKPKDADSGALPERTIQEARLYEVGPVTFPAYDATSVGIRSHEDFTAWRGLSDEKRAQVRTLIFDTESDEAATRTSDDEAVTEHPSEPERAATPQGLSNGERERALRELTL